jgi:hypothetical protein
MLGRATRRGENYAGTLHLTAGACQRCSQVELPQSWLLLDGPPAADAGLTGVDGPTPCRRDPRRWGSAPAGYDENSTRVSRAGDHVELSSPGDENPAMVRLGLRQCRVLGAWRGQSDADDHAVRWGSSFHARTTRSDPAVSPPPPPPSPAVRSSMIPTSGSPPKFGSEPFDLPRCCPPRARRRQRGPPVGSAPSSGAAAVSGAGGAGRGSSASSGSVPRLGGSGTT